MVRARGKTRGRNKVTDPRRHESPHEINCQCQWCLDEKQDMRRLGHWYKGGMLSHLEEVNQNMGKTPSEEVGELF
jgi:hypothetical protein